MDIIDPRVDPSLVPAGSKADEKRFYEQELRAFIDECVAAEQNPTQAQTLERFDRFRPSHVDHLMDAVKREDWRAVIDIAIDLREIDAQRHALRLRTEVV